MKKVRRDFKVNALLFAMAISVFPALGGAKPLHERLLDEKHQIRESALKELDAMDSPSKEKLAAALIHALKDESLSVRASTIRALERMGPVAISVILKALKDEDVAIRVGAATALGEIEIVTKEIVPALAQALKDKVADVRKYAIIALGEIGPRAKEAAPALRRALKDEDRDVRRAAAVALRNIER